VVFDPTLAVTAIEEPFCSVRMLISNEAALSGLNVVIELRVVP
jgi:hypothetical protein